MTGYELKSGARILIRENAPKIFVFSLIFIVLTAVMGELQLRLLGVADAYERYLDLLIDGEQLPIGAFIAYFRPSGGPFAVLLWLLSSILDVGVMSHCLKITRAEENDYKDLLDGFLFFGKVILLRIMTVVLIALWSLLFFFPGIAAAYRYRQAYYILLDDPKKSALTCIRESKRLMRKRKLDLFLIDLSFIGWFLLNGLVSSALPIPFSLPIVAIFLTPYHGLTCAAFYNRIVGEIAV